MSDKNFFKSLFDFSFTSFVTTTIIKIIYGLALGFVALWTFFLGIGSLYNISQGEVWVGILGLVILCPMTLVFGTIMARVYCELLALMFRIAETLVDIENNTRRG